MAPTSWSERWLIWRRYVWVVLGSGLSVPVFVYALLTSLHFMDAPFPGFLLTTRAVIPTVGTLSWPPDRTTLFHARVLAVDGMPVHSNLDLLRYVRQRPAGTVFRYEIQVGDRVESLSLPSRNFGIDDYLQTYGLMLLVGGSYLLLGLLVGILQPRGRQARVFLLQSCIAGLYPVSGVFLHSPDTPYLAHLTLILECFFGFAWVHLAMVFPKDHLFSRRWSILPYVLAVMLSSWVLLGWHSEPPRLHALHFIYLCQAGGIIAFLGAVLFAYTEESDPLVRARITTILPGILVSCVLPIVGFIDNALSGRAFPVQFALLLIPFLQVSIAYAIVKHDLFDIDRILRQSFVYGLWSLMIAGLYALVLVAVAQFAPSLVDQHQRWLGVMLALATAFSLAPARRAAQVLVDRAFYRTRPDYQGTIGALSSSMTVLLDLDEIAKRVTLVPTESMHLQCTVLYLSMPPEIRKWRRTADGVVRQESAPPALSDLVEILHFERRDFLAAGSDDRVIRDAVVRDCLRKDGVQVALPLTFGAQPVGLLGLGAKLSGQPFWQDDIRLLRTLADGTAVAVHNANSYQRLQDLARTLDAKVKEQTEELRHSHNELRLAYDGLKAAQAQLVQSEKMASLGQLVAGVAHELNNPASFIYGGLANLADYIQRIENVVQAYERIEIADAAQREDLQRQKEKNRLSYVMREMPELLRICSEGAERIRKIIDDLRMFARAESGERRLVDIAGAIDRCIRFLANRIDAGAVEIVRAYEENLPPVPLDADRLSHVWLNLLANALDAVEGHPLPVIRVAVRRVGGAGSEPPCVEVVISDNGVGIVPEILPRIWEPFFTTKPVGQGTGLGLSIAYGAVKAHGGTIWFESEPGIGTRATVRLPLNTSGGEPIQCKP